MLKAARREYTEAEPLFREASDIFRGLVSSYPRRFREQLADSLTYLGVCQAGLKSWGPAAEALMESSLVHEQIYQDRSEVAAEPLLRTYVLLSAVQLELSDCPAAEATVGRASLIIGAERHASAFRRVEQACSTTSF